MECKTILVTVLVAALGIAAAVAGFAAEAKKVKKNQPTLVFYGLEPECEYPSSPAMGIAIAGAVAIIFARAIITSATGGCCSCCLSKPNGSKVFARVCIVISWISSSIAVVMFLAGAKLSKRNSVAIDINGVYECYTVRPGVFSGAGIMGLVSVILGLIYYFIYVMGQSGASEKSDVELELEKPPIVNDKKPTMYK